MPSLRPSIVASSLITVALSIILGYASLTLWKEEPIYSSASLLSSIVLLALAIGALRGSFWAMNMLSIFYFILAAIGIIVLPQLPSEGILIFIFSLILGYYIWRYRYRPYREASIETLEREEEWSEDDLQGEDM